MQPDKRGATFDVHDARTINAAFGFAPVEVFARFFFGRKNRIEVGYAQQNFALAAWTAEKNARLKSFVAQAHARGLWIRFYTLDGASKAEQDANGWFEGYNFPSLDDARLRWVDCIRDGVDYLASDQYELVSALARKLAPIDPPTQQR